ncbi:MAG: hypothetical protein RLZZ616_525 [Pseudomonadota bacterium]|jgi:hypothetical protein
MWLPGQMLRQWMNSMNLTDITAIRNHCVRNPGGWNMNPATPD